MHNVKFVLLRIALFWPQTVPPKTFLFFTLCSTQQRLMYDCACALANAVLPTDDVSLEIGKFLYVCACVFSPPTSLFGTNLQNSLHDGNTFRTKYHYCLHICGFLFHLIYCNSIFIWVCIYKWGPNMCKCRNVQHSLLYTHKSECIHSKRFVLVLNAI